MNFFAVLYLVTSVILLLFGIFVFSRNQKSSLHRVFLLLTLTASWWSFTEFMLLNSLTYTEAFFWTKLIAFWTFIPALALNFILIFRQPPGKPGGTWIYPFIYVPAILFCILELATDIVNKGPVMKYGGYSVSVADNPWIHNIELAWLFGLMMISLLCCLHYYLNTRDTRRKEQAKYIIIGFGSPWIAALVFLVILPAFGIYYIEMTAFFTLFFPCFVGYAIWKYDLFVLTPATAADTIISTMTDMLILLDAEEKIVAVNRATLEKLEYTEDDLIGRPVSMAMEDPRDKPGFLADLNREGESISDVEMVCRKKDGTTIPVSVSGLVIRDNVRSVSGIVIVLRDITERKLSEDALKQALTKLNLLSSITRHDILNQVSALKINLELSRVRVTDPETERYLAQTQRIADVIDREISFTRDYEEMGASAPVWQDVVAGHKKVNSFPSGEDTRIVADVEGIEVFADPLFEKVFYNLIDNALRYGGEGLTTIRVSAAESATGLVLTCEDDGAGLTPEEKIHIFQKGHGKHTGLGLFLVREILSITGINITETGVPGRGARFEILVPRGAFRYSGTEAG